MKENLNDIRLSAHFMLGEFINLQKYADILFLSLEHIAQAWAADDILCVAAQFFAQAGDVNIYRSVGHDDNRIENRLVFLVMKRSETVGYPCDRIGFS